MSTLHKRGYRPKLGEREIAYFDSHDKHWFKPRDAWRELWVWGRQVANGAVTGVLADTSVSEDRLARGCLDAREEPDPLALPVWAGRYKTPEQIVADMHELFAALRGPT